MRIVWRCAFAAVLAAASVTCALTAGPAAAREEVSFDGYPVGTIVIRTAERKLYLVLGVGRALRYPVAVGRPGKQWAGEAFVAAKQVRPAWSPPADVLRDKPWLPDVIPPGPNNPLGERALLLDRGQYAIHGTNKPESIGTFASYGCIRMHNHDIVDLFNRVQVGTPVVVTQ